ncbi:hypothetical protein SNE40_009722 [Patella caerulea]|uniref:Transposable element P transposase-like GTP-binding insertion domain-containing protein n=1 Tax=Patella caerulea TaxID=87958 RepID=A0AAN8PYW2_PATCE
MKVNFAAQVFSRSVGKVIEKFGGEEAQETAKFILLIDRFFDCLNVRSKFEGQKKRKTDLMPYESIDDPRFKFLTDDFLGYLKDWKKQVDDRAGFSKIEKLKMFLTHQTYKGLVITVKSVVEATKFLLQTLPRPA